jgi:hypothetical protein
MKQLIFGFSIIATLFFISSCNNQVENKVKKEVETVDIVEDTISSNTILVYYFHGSIRCHTCISVDEKTHEYLEYLFPQMMQNKEIIFKSINIDEDERPDLLEKYEIYGQTLLFIKGETVINETDDAFQYVITNPEKWQQIVEDRIFDLIN